MKYNNLIEIIFHNKRDNEMTMVILKNSIVTGD